MNSSQKVLIASKLAKKMKRHSLNPKKRRKINFHTKNTSRERFINFDLKDTKIPLKESETARIILKKNSMSNTAKKGSEPLFFKSKRLIQRSPQAERIKYDKKSRAKMGSRISKKAFPEKLGNSSERLNILDGYLCNSSTRSKCQSRLEVFRLSKNQLTLHPHPYNRMAELKEDMKYKYNGPLENGVRDFKTPDKESHNFFCKTFKQPLATHLPSLQVDNKKEASNRCLRQTLNPSLAFTPGQTKHPHHNFHNNSRPSNDKFLMKNLQFHHMSVKGYIPIRPDKKNQDSYVARIIHGVKPKPNIDIKNALQEEKCPKSSDKIALLGVFDGHGKHGHLMSNKVKDIFSQDLEGKNLCNPRNIMLGKNNFNVNPPKQATTSRGLGKPLLSEVFEKDSDCIKDFFKKIQESITSGHGSSEAPKVKKEDSSKSVPELDNSSDSYKKETKSVPLCNPKFSGTTACVCIVHGTEITCANVGDSKAVLFSYDQDKKWSAVSLSKEHACDIPEEKVRIELSGGEIKPFYDPNGNPFGPQRVWKSGCKKPGLAMTRSLGDTYAHSVGVTCVPEIRKYRVPQKGQGLTHFLILATDGLWEQFSVIEVLKFLKQHHRKDISEMTELLVSLSREKWAKNEKIIDDITIIIAKF
ncbi:unnamed protein product [Moneuplotes crassus]|uniref:PPM-type phosphatase domain-containing protein n=1 Tax=Euplotes crassus TaxID=5936 RepID=A0AAD1YAD4_EUPCR|nr:unnamed protein product [Moneuplotes crassus]